MKNLSIVLFMFLGLFLLTTNVQAQSTAKCSKASAKTIATKASSDSKACCDGVLAKICEKLCPPGCCGGKSSATSNATTEANIPTVALDGVEVATDYSNGKEATACCKKATNTTTNTATTQAVAKQVKAETSAKKACCKKEKTCSKVKA